MSCSSTSSFRFKVKVCNLQPSLGPTCLMTLWYWLRSQLVFCSHFPIYYFVESLSYMGLDKYYALSYSMYLLLIPICYYAKSLSYLGWNKYYALSYSIYLLLVLVWYSIGSLSYLRSNKYYALSYSINLLLIFNYTSNCLWIHKFLNDNVYSFHICTTWLWYN